MLRVQCQFRAQPFTSESHNGVTAIAENTKVRPLDLW